MNNKIKKILLVPLILILFVSVLSLSGCTELVITEDYSLSGDEVTLKGSALMSEDLINENVKFAIDTKSHSRWDEYESHIKPLRTWREGNRLYFEAVVGGLQMGQDYYFRAGAYYHYPMEPPEEPEMGQEVKFVCGTTSEKNNIQTSNIDNGYYLSLFYSFLEKHPSLFRYISILI